MREIALILAVCFASTRLAAQPTPGSIMTHALPATGPSAIDALGNVYVTGYSGALKATPGAAQTQSGGGSCPVVFFPFPPTPEPCPDAFILKADASGNTVFATLLGGPTTDYGTAIAVDAAGNVYVTGSTGGSFPTTQNAAIPVSTTSTAFAAKLSADGSKFLYSTYLPDIVATESAIAVDAQGNAYIVGQTTANHACVIKLSADGSTVVYTKVLSGANQESAAAVVADAEGDAIVTGSTSSPDFPTSAGAVQTRLAGAQNAFLTKLDPGGIIVSSTFLGGSGSEQASAIQLDSSGNLYIAGGATSLDFPTTPGSFEPAALVPAWSVTPGGFVAKLSPDFSSLMYSSYVWSLGPIALAIGPSGDAYLAGFTENGFPSTPSAPLPCVPGNFDLSGGDFVAHLDANGVRLDATYVNDQIQSAISVASDGSVLLAGDYLSKIRFGDPGWVASPCMALTVFNSATLAPTLVSPGQFVSLAGFGIGPEIGVGAQADAQGTPTSLGGVQVFFDGNPAPVVYAQSRQVNAQAPFELNGQSSTNVTLRYNGVTFGPVTMEVAFANPGLFRLQPNISSQAYAVNQDGTFNGPSNPAPRGSVVAFWGTGFGSTSPPCATGGLNAPGPVNLAADLSVMMLGGGPVQYAGSAPTLACGITQINMQVPVDATPGIMRIDPQAVLAPQQDGVASNVASFIYIR